MRVIGGELRSRRLACPSGTGTRPTSDRLRETLFNVLTPRLAGAQFADLYAGSGAVGIEALSRGAAFCFFAEKAPAAVKVLRGNLAGLGLAGRFALEDRGVRPLLQGLAEKKRIVLDIVFLDPPYQAEEDYRSTLEILGRKGMGWLAPGAVVVAEHARRTPPPMQFGTLERTRLLEQGDAALSFYTVANPPATAF